MSIISEGNTNLDEHKNAIEPGDYRVENINGHIYSIFPIGVPIPSLPFVLVINEKVIERPYAEIERMIAAFKPR